MKPKTSYPVAKFLAVKSSKGFTLVETVIAMGIVAFAMLGILGLVPVGLNNFREAMNNTAESQIIQSVSNDILLTDYDKVVTDYLDKTNFSYYNDEGGILSNSSDPNRAFEVKVSSSSLAPTILTPTAASVDPDDAAGQTIRIEVRKVNSSQAVGKIYSFVVPKG